MTTTTIAVAPASASTDGRGIKIAATATPGTALHTYQASATDMDVIEARVYNSDTVDRKITFENGGVNAPDDNLGGTVPAGETRTFVMAGRNGLALKAFAAATNVLSVHIIKRKLTVA